MELIGGETTPGPDGKGDNVIHATVHWALDGDGAAVQYSQDFSLPSGVRFADDFHVFWTEWTPTFLAIGVDDVSYYNITLAGTSVIPEFERATASPLFWILNVAVGGDWGGDVDQTTVFPQTMLVDYVRVFQM